MHWLLRDSIPYYESFLTSENEGGRESDFRRCKRSSRLEHRMDVTMTAGSKKAASHKRQTDGGISGKSIVENARPPPTGLPSVTRVGASERAHAFRECGGVSQIERTILFLPSDWKWEAREERGGEEVRSSIFCKFNSPPALPAWVRAGLIQLPRCSEMQTKN